MFPNYLKSAVRAVRRHLGYTVINVIGLAVGIAVCLLITLYVRHELSYDDFHEDAEQIYRVVTQGDRSAAPRASWPAIREIIQQNSALWLAALTAQQRTREIGIRKAVGATAGQIVRLLSKDFAVLVGMGVAIAAPVAYIALEWWLSTFAYHIDVGPGVLLIAGGSALLVALLTVSTQAYRAARTDPATTLRDE